MSTIVQAAPLVRQLLSDVKQKYHPHLQQALIGLAFADTKPYIRDCLNLGKVAKFTPAARLWMAPDKQYDFSVTLSVDVWFEVLNDAQREALLDLNLTRCKVEYEPETVQINGRKQIVKNEYGLTQYTDVMKTDDEGRPVWRVAPLDIMVLAENLKRYGAWYTDLIELKQAVETPPGG